MKSRYIKTPYPLAINDLHDNQPKDSTDLRKKIVRYALKFEGNPYKYGGTSLTRGADCSGFVQAIYKAHGIHLPRTSRLQAKSGRVIPLNALQPADLIFYKKNGLVNHVALYIGNHKVIHASDPKSGIKISKYNYRKPYKTVDYIDIK
jgi:cell wall-associated NlpC family hydrolase